MLTAVRQANRNNEGTKDQSGGRDEGPDGPAIRANRT